MTRDQGSVGRLSPNPCQTSEEGKGRVGEEERGGEGKESQGQAVEQHFEDHREVPGLRTGPSTPCSPNLAGAP